jgi:nitroreductase
MPLVFGDAEGRRREHAQALRPRSDARGADALSDPGKPLGEEALDVLFREARSYKRFEPTPVPAETLHAIYALAKFGPTASNSNPGRFLFLVSEEARARLAALAEPGNRPKIMSAPCVIVVAYDLDFHEKMAFLRPDAPDSVGWWPTEEGRHYDGLRNSSLQGGYLMLAARALGLDVGPMGGFDREAVDEAFFPGERIRSNFIIALGRGTTEKLHPRQPRFGFDEVCRIL